MDAALPTRRTSLAGIDTATTSKWEGHSAPGKIACTANAKYPLPLRVRPIARWCVESVASERPASPTYR